MTDMFGTFPDGRSRSEGGGGERPLRPAPDVLRSDMPLSYDDICATRNSLAMRWFDHADGDRSLALVSPRSFTGRANYAASLAACFAQGGLATLLIDANLREPLQHTFFGIERGQGLADFLALPTNPMPWHHVAENLTVMTAGSPAADSQDLLLGPGLEALFHRARTEFQVVIADTPAAHSCADFQIIVAQAIGALVVMREGRTLTREAQDLVQDCRSFGARVVGSVMVAGT